MLGAALQACLGRTVNPALSVSSLGRLARSNYDVAWQLPSMGSLARDYHVTTARPARGVLACGERAANATPVALRKKLSYTTT